MRQCTAYESFTIPLPFLDRPSPRSHDIERMRKQVSVFVASLFASTLLTASGHPASGIVVDPSGQVFFIYSGHGVCKIDAQGRLSYIHRTRGGHWMCLDDAGSFSHTQPRYFERISPDGVTPAIIFADGGSPIAVLPDGNLYYASGTEDLNPGALQLVRNTPRGDLSFFAPAMTQLARHRGITGLATGMDGNLYVACPNAVAKIKQDGTVSTLADPIHLQDCDVDRPDNSTNIPLPYLRGLAADRQGTVFAAATSCHCVIKISPAGNVETVLKAARPWTPTGIAMHDGEVYVLEYTHANEAATAGWFPRVRKIARDGTVTTLVTVTADTQISGEQ